MLKNYKPTPNEIAFKTYKLKVKDRKFITKRIKEMNKKDGNIL